MSRRRTTRIKRTGPERRLHLKVSSPRIVGFECLRYLKKSGKLLLLCGLLLGGLWGAKSGLRKFFIENEEFQLTAIDLETNGELDEAHFAEVTGLRADSSIFSLELASLRAKLLERPGVTAAELTRRLPGTLRVRVTERVPVAWLECRPLGIIGKDPASGLLLDETGVCFPCDSWWDERAKPLPVLLVSQVEEGDVTIGKELRHHEARRALELIKLSREMLSGLAWSLPVVAVRNDYSLEAATSTGLLATFGMYEHKRQLEDLITLVHTTGALEQPIAGVNLIPERNIPVRTGIPGSLELLPENRLQRDIKALLKQ